MKIAKGTIVSIHYDLLDAEGKKVETTRNEDPVCYRHGGEEILPGLEKALTGHAAGDEFRVTLAPDDAYGEYSPEGIVSIPRAELDPTSSDVKSGDWIVVTVREDGERVEGEDDELDMRVVEVHDEEIILDANHPLAGQAVTFLVEVVAVSASGPE